MSDVLSQEEINALLSAFQSAERTETGVLDAAGPKAVKKYDFTRPDKFSKDQLRTLQMLHETFARDLATSFTVHVRTMVKTAIVSVEQQLYDEFLMSLPTPTVLCIFRMSPLDGSGVLEISPVIVFSIIDRLLGGEGRPISRARELTEIEQSMMRRVLGGALESLKEAWVSAFQVDVALQSIESNSQFAQITSPSDTVSIIVLETTIGATTGTIRLCLPYMLLQPILPKLNVQHWFSDMRKGDIVGKPAVMRKGVERIRVPVVAELGVAEVPIRDVVELEPGDVIRLDTRTEEPIRVLVGNLVKFLGKPGCAGRRLAIQVTDVVREGAV